MPKIIPAISETEPSLSVAEARQFLGGVTRLTLSNYTQKRGFVGYKIGGKYYYLASDLKAFTALPAPKPKLDLKPPKVSAETRAKLRAMGIVY